MSPLKLGKSVLTLTESTKKYPLTAENLRPLGRLRGGRQISDRRPQGVNYATYGRQAVSRRQKVKSQKVIYGYSTLSTRHFPLFKHMYLL